jgi:hypothetical protein
MWPLVRPKARHLWALLVFVPALLFIQHFIVVRSDDYLTAETFVANDKRLSEVIGPIQKADFKFWDEFTSVGGVGGSASYSFDVVTGKGKFVAVVELRNDGKVWHVVAAHGHDANGGPFRVTM